MMLEPRLRQPYPHASGLLSWLKLNKLKNTVLILLLFLIIIPVQSYAMQATNIDEQMAILARGDTPPRLIRGAKFRVGVFTYEDPDNTGLGNAVAALMAHEIIMNSGVRSLGVIRFESSLSPDTKRQASYFDKVERITTAQGVTLSVWGNIRRSKNKLLIDTYVQIPEKSLQRYCTKTLTLPRKMGGEKLLMQMRPDRFPVQRLVIDANEVDEIKKAAAALFEVRAEPSVTSSVVGKVPKDKVYYFTKRDGDWVQLKFQGGGKGWIPISGHCINACRPIIDAAAFVGSLQAYMSNGRSIVVTKGLTEDALAVKEQVMALKGYNRFSLSARSANKSLNTALRWVGTERLTSIDDKTDSKTGIQRSRGVPPGGAAFANIKAISELAIALQEMKSSGNGDWNQIELPVEKVKSIAFDLADASQYDPRNKEVLHNLAVLFEFIGDEKRASLARSLLEKK